MILGRSGKGKRSFVLPILCRQLAACLSCLVVAGAGCGASRPPEGAAGPGRVGADDPARPLHDAGPSVDADAGGPADALSGPSAGSKADRRRGLRRAVIAGDAISDRFVQLTCDPGWPAGAQAFLDFARSIAEVREARFNVRTEGASVVYRSGVLHVFHHHPEEGEEERCDETAGQGIATACGCGCLDPERFCHGEGDPAVRYGIRDPDRCAVTDYACPDGQMLFADACGCGCLAGTPRCPAEDAAGVTYRSRDPIECEEMDAACPDGEQPFPG